MTSQDDETSSSSGRWQRFSARIFVIWTVIGVLAGACVAVAEKRKLIVDTIHSMRQAIWPPELPKLVEERGRVGREITDEDEYRHFSGAIAFDNSDRPRIVFEQALGGRIRLLIKNDTGRQLNIARARVINGYPSYAHEDQSVDYPTSMSFEMKDCADQDAFLKVAESKVVNLCPARNTDFNRYLPYNLADQRNDGCAVDIHFVTPDGVRLHHAFKVSCYDLSAGFTAPRKPDRHR